MQALLGRMYLVVRTFTTDAACKVWLVLLVYTPGCDIVAALPVALCFSTDVRLPLSSTNVTGSVLDTMASPGCKSLGLADLHILLGSIIKLGSGSGVYCFVMAKETIWVALLWFCNSNK